MLIPTTLLVLLAVVVALYIRAGAATAERHADEWATAHGLALTEGNRPMVCWYLRTARSLRAWGVVAGLVLPPLVSLAVNGLSLRVPWGWAWLFAGYLVGALYAEIALVRPLAPHRRMAALEPREVEEYLPAAMLHAQRALGGAALVLALAVAFVPYGGRSHTTDAPNRVTFVVLALVAVAFAAALERVQRWLVRRPQPLTQPDLVAADDAIRSQSVHSLAGSGIAVLLLLVSSQCWALAVSDVQVLRWAMWVPAVFGFVLALFACQVYGHRPWRVRRSAVLP